MKKINVLLRLIAFTYFQIYYRFYELNSKNPNQARKLASGAILFILLFNLVTIVLILMLLKVFSEDIKIDIFIICSALSLIITFITEMKCFKYLEKNLIFLKSQNNSLQLKWRISVLIYATISVIAPMIIEAYL